MFPQPSSDELLIRLKAHTITENSCWLYQLGIADGYGRMRVNGKLTGVHRVSAMIYLGYNLSDEINQVLHNAECPNRNCWNPDHLHIGTNEENHAERRNKKTHCINGHEYTEENTFINVRGRRECMICKRDARKRHREWKYGI